ncbi:glycosyl hydrolase family 28 protein [Terrimonas sp. NA20]|uniref:Glycosyl hydrolase family 28 protein n=1 Tax=Terrimonas ginsenosidimutans TaxID=2908004 RepID=A0ABS9KMI9_9BACT|nr:glycosyl hydrolase family 28 protein [Terrimonas ginsenosidimutans]MCG2613524.1 glycosyl hydrolase family 28 protein [Terrimonas ginsenosidimutans]
MRTSFLLLFTLLSSYWLHAQVDHNITTYKAKGDGKTLNTKAIQAAIDNCALKGGGTVWVPAGIFVTGCIYLKDNVNLHLSNGAVLKATPELSEYDRKTMALVYVRNAVNVSITGMGIINGNGKNFKFVEEGPDRPFVVLVESSKQVIIRDVKLYDGARWTLKLFDSDHVQVSGVTIYSHSNHNNDGIDIDSRNVTISDCIIDSDDDAICLKSENPNRITENITVTNCIVSSNCNFIKMGTGSFSGFRNISITNCVLKAAAETPFWKWHNIVKGVKDTISGLAGIALEIVDGGMMDQIVISNITMTGVQTPVFIRLGNRKNAVGSLKNVLISNITATANSLIPSIIAAVPGFYIENVTFRDMILRHTGGGTEEDVKRAVPENEAKYPENRMLGHTLPAYGLYVRHARNITLDNIQFIIAAADARPAIWLEDVKGVYIKDFSPGNNARPSAMIRQTNVTDFFYQNLREH